MSANSHESLGQVELNSHLWDLVASSRKKSKSRKPHSPKPYLLAESNISPINKARIQESLPQEELIAETQDSATLDSNILVVDFTAKAQDSKLLPEEGVGLAGRIMKRIKEGTLVSRKGIIRKKDYEEEKRTYEDIVDFGLHARTRIRTNILLEESPIAS